MKSFIILALFAAVAVALPVDDKNAQIVSYSSDNIGVDGFQFKYETSNGINGGESAVLKNPGSEAEAIEVRGSFSYLGTDGKLYSVEYIANENGFQPSGAHLPV